MSPTVCVFGAGAIGGYLAARLAHSGASVSIIARGAHLAAVQRHGLVLHSGGVELVTHPRAAAHGDALGPQDYVVLTLKSHALEAALPQLQPLVGPHTTIVTAINGMPWWYTHGISAPFTDRRIKAVDPLGALWAALPPRQCLGCVVYPAATVTAPGVVHHLTSNLFTLGELDGAHSVRAKRLSNLMEAAGLQAPIHPQIRDEVWSKLWGNMAFNPISALTLATLGQIAGDPDTAALATAVMREGEAVAAALGITFRLDAAERINRAAAVGPHKTSMLQDLERGRALELDAIVGAVVEMAGWVDVPMPMSKALLALTHQRSATMQQNCHQDTRL